MRNLSVKNSLFKSIEVLARLKGQTSTRVVNEVLTNGLLQESFAILQHLDPDVDDIKHLKEEGK